MRRSFFRSVALLACFAITVSVFGFQGKKGGGEKAADALTGTWSGDWGPSPADRNSVNVDMKLNGTTITGTVHSVNFQRPDVELKNSTYDPKAGTVHMEADAPGRGGDVHFVIEGKISGGTMSGSWNHGATKGDFKLTKK